MFSSPTRADDDVPRPVDSEAVPESRIIEPIEREPPPESRQDAPAEEPSSTDSSDRSVSVGDNSDAEDSSDEIAPGGAADGPGFLDTIVVTATGLEEEGFYLPYTVDSLDGTQLTARKAFRTLPESLREVPGVHVQKTGHGQGSPFIRGFTGFRTLLLIDGIRLNNAVLRDGPNQYWGTVDPLTIDRLDVVKGPSSVLYGSDAIGGTVNAITRGRDPGSVGERLLGLGGRAFYRYSSAEDSHTTRGEVSATPIDGLGLLGGISYKSFGDLSGGRDTGELANTGYDELDGDLKAIWRLSSNVELVLAFQSVRQEDVPRTHSTVFSKSFRGTSIGTDLRRDLDQRRYLGYAQLHWTPEDVAWLSKLSLSASWHQQEEVEERTRSSLRRRRQGFEDGQLGLWARAESPSPLGTLTWGAEFYRDHVDSFFSEVNGDGSPRAPRPRGPVADDATYDLVGLYLQDSVQLADPLELVLGGRLTYAHAAADKVDPDPTMAPAFGPLDEEFFGAAGSARLLWEVHEVCNLFGGVSQGFRAPNLSDLTRFDVARSGEVETPAPGLDPEDFVTFEIGTKLLFEDAALADHDVQPGRVEAYASYHYTLIDDMIVRFPTGATIDGDPVVTKANVGDGFVQGIEVGASWNFWRGFSAFGTLAWLDGEVDNFIGGRRTREPLSRLQPLTALLGLRWDSDDGRFWAEASVTIADDQDHLSSRDAADTQRIPPRGTPGYTVFSLRGGAEVLEGLHLFGAIENLSDVDYRVHGSGQNEPGTNAILGAEWRF